jgi:hypothetical protein
MSINPVATMFKPTLTGPTPYQVYGIQTLDSISESLNKLPWELPAEDPMETSETDPSPLPMPSKIPLKANIPNTMPGAMFEDSAYYRQLIKTFSKMVVAGDMDDDTFRSLLECITLYNHHKELVRNFSFSVHTNTFDPKQPDA